MENVFYDISVNYLCLHKHLFLRETSIGLSSLLLGWLLSCWALSGLDSGAVSSRGGLF